MHGIRHVTSRQKQDVTSRHGTRHDTSKPHMPKWVSLKPQPTRLAHSCYYATAAASDSRHCSALIQLLMSSPPLCRAISYSTAQSRVTLPRRHQINRYRHPGTSRCKIDINIANHLVTPASRRLRSPSPLSRGGRGHGFRAIRTSPVRLAASPWSRPSTRLVFFHDREKTRRYCRVTERSSFRYSHRSFRCHRRRCHCYAFADGPCHAALG